MESMFTEAMATYMKNANIHHNSYFTTTLCPLKVMQANINLYIYNDASNSFIQACSRGQFVGGMNEWNSR